MLFCAVSGKGGVFVDGSVVPTACLKTQSIHRVQNIPYFKTYYAKKQAISAKNIPSLQSTQMLGKFGGVDTFLINTVTNEVYMWLLTTDAMEVTKGNMLKMPKSKS